MPIRTNTDPYGDRGPGAVRRWVTITLVVVAVIGLLVAVMVLIGGGHGPRRHGSPGDSGGRTPPSGVIASHLPPAGDHP